MREREREKRLKRRTFSAKEAKVAAAEEEEERRKVKNLTCMVSLSM